MKESIAIAKETDVKKGFPPSRIDKTYFPQF